MTCHSVTQKPEFIQVITERECSTVSRIWFTTERVKLFTVTFSSTNVRVVKRWEESVRGGGGLNQLCVVLLRWGKRPLCIISSLI